MMGVNPREELVPKLFAPALACLAALGLASCTPTTPTQTPRPEPTFQCTPEAGGTPMPCTQQQHDDMVAKDALYAEAEAVTREFYAELEKMYRAGGYAELPPELEAMTAGSARTSTLDLTRKVHGRASKSVGGEFKLVWIRRNVGAVKEASEVSVVACVDARSTRTVTPGKPETSGGVGTDALFFRHVEGVLKVWADGPSDMEGCS